MPGISRYITFNDKTRHLSNWAKTLDISPSLIHYRLSHGWSVEQALSKMTVNRAAKDLTGMKFDRLVVIKRHGSDTRISKITGKKIKNSALWHCRCECGKEINVRGKHLRDGQSSCGCLTREILLKIRTKHSGTAKGYKRGLYNSWRDMNYRCYNSKKESYQWYGGRGITVSDEWRNSFIAFRNWALENGWKEKLTLDRINVNGNYEPSNCRWISNQDQASNRRPKNRRISSK